MKLACYAGRVQRNLLSFFFFCSLRGRVGDKTEQKSRGRNKSGHNDGKNVCAIAQRCVVFGLFKIVCKGVVRIHLETAVIC